MADEFNPTTHHQVDVVERGCSRSKHPPWCHRWWCHQHVMRLLMFVCFTAGLVVAAAAFTLISASEDDDSQLPLAPLTSKRLAQLTAGTGSNSSSSSSGGIFPAAAASIPKLLHYAFESGGDKVNMAYRQLIGGCIDRNPGWRVQLWSNADVRRLLGRLGPAEPADNQLLALYASLDSQAERENLAKYPILYSSGGVFLEPDVDCVMPLDLAVAAAAPAGAFLAKERPENHRILENSPFKLATSAMGAAPAHPWFAFALDLLRGHAAEDVSLDESFTTQCYRAWLNRLPPAPTDSPALLPWQYFASTLRNPQTMARLCQQLSQWPQLAAVYKERSAACSSSSPPHWGRLGASSSNSNGSEATVTVVGVRRHGLRRLITATAAAAAGQRFNATEAWQLKPPLE